MSTLVQPTMPKPKSEKPKRDDVAVKVDRSLANKASLIARVRRISVAEYLSEQLREPIERDWPKAIKEADKKSQA